MVIVMKTDEMLAEERVFKLNQNPKKRTNENGQPTLHRPQLRLIENKYETNQPTTLAE